MRSVNFLVAIICSVQVAFSSEHGAPEPAEHGAPAASEHGGAAVPEAAYSGKQSQQWTEVQTKLAAAKSKMEAQEAVVKSLMHPGFAGGAEKAGGGHDAPAAPTGHGESNFEQLKKEDEKLTKLVAEYNRLNTEYETKFPEKGLKETRIYKRLDPQSAAPLENAGTAYEYKSQKLQTKILKQYPNSAQNIKRQKNKVVKKTDSLNHKENLSDEKTGDGVTDQIILQK